jgi:hypothetical protein
VAGFFMWTVALGRLLNFKLCFNRSSSRCSEGDVKRITPYAFPALGWFYPAGVGVRRGASRGLEDGLGPSTLWAGHSWGGLKDDSEWPTRRASKGRAWHAQLELYNVHGHPFPYAHTD